MSTTMVLPMRTTMTTITRPIVLCALQGHCNVVISMGIAMAWHCNGHCMVVITMTHCNGKHCNDHQKTIANRHFNDHFYAGLKFQELKYTKMCHVMWAVPPYTFFSVLMTPHQNGIAMGAKCHRCG